MSVRVAVTVLLLTGCTGPGLAPGSVPPTGVPSTSAATTDPTARADPSASSGGTATSPPMPVGFPVHESMRRIDPEGSDIAAWESDGVPSEVYEFYVDELAAAGFVVDLAAPGGEAAIIRFSSPDGTAWQLDLTGRTPFQVALGPPHD